MDSKRSSSLLPPYFVTYNLNDIFDDMAVFLIRKMPKNRKKETNITINLQSLIMVPSTGLEPARLPNGF